MTIEFLPSIFPSIRVFSVSRLFASGGQEYWSLGFSISPSNEYLGLIGLTFLQLGDSQVSSSAPQFESISSSAFGLLYGPTLTFVWFNLLWGHCSFPLDPGASKVFFFLCVCAFLESLEDMGFGFKIIEPLLPSWCSLFFVLGLGLTFLVGSNILLLMVVQQLVEILVFSKKMSTGPSTLPS